LDEKGKLIQELLNQHEATLKSSDDLLGEVKSNHTQTIVSYEKLIKDLSADKEQLIIEVEGKSSLIERITAQKEKEVENLMLTIKEEKERNKEFHVALVVEQSKLEESRNRAESLTAKIQELNKEGKVHLSEINGLNNLLKDQEAEKDKLEHRLNITSNKLAIKNHGLEEAQSQINQLNERIEELESMSIFKFLSKNKKK